MLHTGTIADKAFTAYEWPNGARFVFLLPIDISFEKVDDNPDIEDNKDADGNWMTGKGKRMFVGAKTPTETKMRDTVYVKLKGAPKGLKVQLKAFDVDDPTPDSLDPQHVIDSNDTDTVKQGNDNRGYDNLGMPQPPHFVSSGDVTVTCTVDDQGVARLDNGELPKLQMTDHPGDNCRIAAAFLKPDGSPLGDGQDVSKLQVDDSTQPGYVPPSDEYPKDGGFSGGLSPMLTVWRKLNIEVDSMEAVATSGDEKNYEEGKVLAVTSGPISGQSTVTVDILLTGPANRYEHGFLTVGGTKYEIVSNTDYWTNFTSGDQVVVKGTVPSSAINQSFTAVDDDDRYLSELGLPAPLPRNDSHADIIKGIRPSFAPAYIQVEDANALGWNPNQTIPFKLNAPPDSTLGSVFNDAKDLTDTNAFWAFTVTLGYQPDTSVDHDPDTEDLMKGGGSKSVLGYSSYGFAAIFMESIRESAIGDLSATSPSALNNPAIQQMYRDGYNNELFGTTAHEIGHSPGGQTEAEDHAEEGLMQAGGATIKEPFSPATINRFRSTENWTH